MRRAILLAAFWCLALVPAAAAAELRTFTLSHPPRAIATLAGAARPALVQGLSRGGRTRWSLNRRAVRLTPAQRRAVLHAPRSDDLRSPDTPAWRLVHRLAALRAAAPPGRLPRGEDAFGRLRYSRDWMAGFWAGALWQATDLTARPLVRSWAVQATLDTAGFEQFDSHDVGFFHIDSLAAAVDHACPGDPRCAAWREGALRAAGTLMALAAGNPAGTIPTQARPCGRCRPGERATIIDSGMNVQLLAWAWQQTGEDAYRAVALRHLERLAALLIRPDGSTTQAVYTDAVTGMPLRWATRQGLGVNSTWARGQAWAIYAYAAAAEAFREPWLLDTARRLAGWWRSRDPAGRVPRWDFDARSGPRDASAATIAAAGLARLAALEPGAKARRWRVLARALLRNAERGMARGLPLGRLRGQVYSYGGERWDENAEFVFGIRYALEAHRRLGALPSQPPPGVRDGNSHPWEVWEPDGRGATVPAMTTASWERSALSRWARGSVMRPVRLKGSGPPPIPGWIMSPRLLLPLLALSALSLFGAAPASAASGLEVAVQDDAHLLSDDAGARAAALDAAAGVGALYVRTNVSWAGTAPAASARRAPANPVYNFSRYDRLVADAAARGIHVQLTLTGPAPAWASGAHRVGIDRPDASRFGAFAGQAAAHFRGRVERYSVWNEPNWHNWLRPQRICRRGRCTVTAAPRYRALYVAAHAAIKRADPAAQVWIGETSPSLRLRRSGAPLSTAPLRFLRELTCRDGIVRGCRGALVADGYAHHPYEFSHAPSWRDPRPDNVTIGTLSRLRRALSSLSRAGKLRHAGGGPMPVYLTEFAYFTSGSRALSPAKRAQYTEQAYDRALREPGVRQLLHYELIDPPATHPWRSGLLDASGRPHPVFRALRDFVTRNSGRLARP
jgi:hypothetical protein